MDFLEAYFLKITSSLASRPTARIVFGFGFIILSFFVQNTPYSIPLLILGCISLFFYLTWLVELIISIVKNKNNINVAMLSLNSDEKEILSKMLISKHNLYEIRIPVDYVPQEGKLSPIDILISLRDKELINLTQLQSEDKKIDVVKAICPWNVWKLLNKNFKKDCKYLTRTRQKPKKNLMKRIRRKKKKS